MPLITGVLTDPNDIPLTHGQVVFTPYHEDARVNGANVALGIKVIDIKDMTGELDLTAGSWSIRVHTTERSASIATPGQPLFKSRGFDIDLQDDTTWGEIYATAVPAPPAISGQLAQILDQAQGHSTAAGGWADAAQESANSASQIALGDADAAMAGAINDSSSEVYAALVAGFARGQVVTHPRWGAGTGKTAAQNTAAIQACIDFVNEQPGKGVVYVPEGIYALGPSTLGETYDNFGTATAANAYCLIVRSGVSLVGAGRNLTELTSSDPAKTLLGLVTPVDVTVSDLRLTGGYVSGGPGPGHGVFILGAPGGTSQKTERVTFRNLHVRNVSSYGIGFQNGYPRGCTVENVLIENTGADGLDLKARGAADTVEMYGNNVRNLVVRNHGMRVIGSAGVDVRGVWHLSNVSVTDFGTRALDGMGAPHAYIGIRFRTPADTPNYWPGEGAKSTLTGFYVKAATSPAATDLTGLVVGSSFVNVSNGTVDGCRNGVTVGGNQLGGPSYSRLNGVHCFNSAVYGFEMLTSATGTVLSNCYTSGSVTAGYRNAGVGTTFANCDAAETTKISTSVAAAATQLITGQTLSEFERGVSVTSSAAGRVSVTPAGPSTDIDLWLNPKGSNGRIRMTAYTAASDGPIVGYIEVKDAAGATRKLAVLG